MPTEYERLAGKALSNLNAGRPASALKTVRGALKTYPEDAYLSNLAGLIMIRMAQPKKAVPHFMTARRGDPEMIEAAQNLAQALIGCRETAKASAVVRKALKCWPENAHLHYLAASAPYEAGDLEAALSAARAGLALLPEDAALHNIRALALQRLDRPEEAEAAFERACAANPDDPEIRRTFAGFLIAQARASAAEEHLDAGLAVRPDHLALLLDRAGLHQQFGNGDAAIACYDRVLDLAPEHPLALNGLAFLLRGSRAQALRGKLSKVQRAPGLGRDIRIVLDFADARLAETTLSADADAKLAKANCRAARAMPYDAHLEAVEQDQLLAPFEGGPACPATLSPGPADERADGSRPAFILGLLRSGTTLAEQALTRHPDVVTLGEWPLAGKLAAAQARDFAEHATGPDGAAFAESYRANLPAGHRRAAVVVDKMPDNRRALDYLLNAFPDAVVIEMRRDPRDVALSMWRDLFPDVRHAHTNSLTGMAAHMNHYARFMQRWRALFGTRIHSLEYSHLVTDIEQATRHLANLCGLEWHPDMLTPGQGTGAVMTASVQQMRQPVHRNSLNKWADRQALLERFTSALDTALWPQLSAS